MSDFRERSPNCANVFLSPFRFEGGMWDVIVSVPDLLPFFLLRIAKTKQSRAINESVQEGFCLGRQ